MQDNQMKIEKVMWCEVCNYLTIIDDKVRCPNCDVPLQDIGFVEDNDKRKPIRKEGKSLGGSVIQGVCGCGEPRAVKGIDHMGRKRYRTQCYKCLYKARIASRDKHCAICKAGSDTAGILELDHINGDRSNNSPKNLQTLCKECHKYKTTKQKEWKAKATLNSK